MKKAKYLIAALFFVISAGLTFTSCDEGGEPEPGGTNMQRYAGDWYISATDTNGDVLFEHALHSTYNTAANDNTMWIDDHTNGWWLKGKVTVDLDNGTFASEGDVENIIVVPGQGPQGSVTITEGKIIKDGGISRGGHVVDSIYFRVHFSYDPPGYDIIHSGHKRTGFLEDEY